MSTNVWRVGMKGVSKQSLIGLGSVVASPYLGPVASRAYYADSKAGTTGGWNSRTSHYARDTITALKIILVNGYVIGGTGETVSGAVSTTTASVEYPAGTFTRITFNSGSTSAAIASGATQISDFATVSIPKNAQFWSRRSPCVSRGCPRTFIVNDRPSFPTGECCRHGIKCGEHR